MTAQPIDPVQPSNHLETVFRKQRLAFEQERYPSAATRIDRLKLIKDALLMNRARIIDALNEDFGNRPAEVTRLAEIGGSTGNLDYCASHVKRWMKPQSRGVSMWFMPGKNQVMPQPKGVVGIVAPWNYPINLAVAPLAAALAAGNRAMIKMSEFTPASAALLKEILAELFDEDLVAVFDGGPDEAAQFTRLAFDHLLFTGSTGVGKKVMAAAAENLTPVTLELGGKSPVLIDEDFDLTEAANRVLWGKTFNAGQTCVAPDYALVPKGQTGRFVAALDQAYFKHFPQGAADDSYTSVIDQRNYDRLRDLVEGARAAGAEIHEIEQTSNDHVTKRKFPLTLVIDPPADSRIMTEEIFGPVLPVLEHEGRGHAIDRVNQGDRPLALYYFGKDGAEEVLQQSHSGGVTTNDVMLQYLQADLPFGGTGASGFGAYHGKEGFETFSHMKAVFRQRGFGSFTGLKMLYPPYTGLARRLITMMGG